MKLTSQQLSRIVYGCTTIYFQKVKVKINESQRGGEAPELPVRNNYRTVDNNILRRHFPNPWLLLERTAIG